MDEQRSGRGQSMLEIAIILPVLIILMVGVAEIGFGLRNYLLVSNANREACRLAAKGERYSDEEIGSRVVSAGGVVSLGGSDVPFLRTYGTEPNTGVIVTRIQTDDKGDVITVTVWVTGVVPSETGGVRNVGEPQAGNPLSPDSKIVLTQTVSHHKPTSEDITAMRQTAGLATMENAIVIVEVYFIHRPLVVSMAGVLANPWVMYAKTEMRESVN